MALIISTKVMAKLATKKPPVTREEVMQCFANRTGSYLLDTREDHASDPPTRWFIAETYYGRKLKIVFIMRDGNIFLRSAFDPNQEELRIYSKYGS